MESQSEALSHKVLVIVVKVKLMDWRDVGQIGMTCSSLLLSVRCAIRLYKRDLSDGLEKSDIPIYCDYEEVSQRMIKQQQQQQQNDSQPRHKKVTKQRSYHLGGPLPALFQYIVPAPLCGSGRNGDSRGSGTASGVPTMDKATYSSCIEEHRHHHYHHQKQQRQRRGQPPEHGNGVLLAPGEAQEGKEVKRSEKYGNGDAEGEEEKEEEEEEDKNDDDGDGDQFEGCGCVDSICLPGRCLCADVNRRATSGGALTSTSTSTSTSTFNAPAIALFECHSGCLCCSAAKCPLRATQQSPQTDCLYLKHTGAGKGWGLFTCKPITQGAFIGCYTGERLTDEQVKRRHAQYDELGGVNYIATYREYFASSAKSVSSSLTSPSAAATAVLSIPPSPSPSSSSSVTQSSGAVKVEPQHQQQRGYSSVMMTHVDAYRRGNFTRFINHCCEPNLELVAVRRGSMHSIILALFTLRPVPAGEELSFHYGGRGGRGDYDVFDNNGAHERKEERTATSTPTSTSTSTSSNTPSPMLGCKKCRCGVKACVGFLPFCPDVTT